MQSKILPMCAIHATSLILAFIAPIFIASIFSMQILRADCICVCQNGRGQALCESRYESKNCALTKCPYELPNTPNPYQHPHTPQGYYYNPTPPMPYHNPYSPHPHHPPLYPPHYPR